MDTPADESAMVSKASRLAGWPGRTKLAAVVAVPVLLVGAVVVSFALAGRGAGVPNPSGQGDLERLVADFVDGMPRAHSGGYDVPSAAEMGAMASAFQAVLDEDLAGASAMAGPLGYRLSSFTDTADGRTLEVLSEEGSPSAAGGSHGWGMYFHDPRSRSPLTVEVAHPLDDVHSALVGVDVFRDAAAANLLVAGTSRYADPHEVADMAHQRDSVFERVHEVALRSTSVDLEPHGFDEAGHPPTYGQIVVSSGSDTPSDLVKSLAAGLAAAGFSVCVYDGRACEGLGGTSNVQGESTREAGGHFVHLEIDRAIRDDPSLRQQLAEIVARTIARGSRA